MGIYSHSKLGTFETCRLQYKYKYIDRIKVDTDTIEAYLGGIVHKVFEKLYKDLNMGKMNTKEALLSYYENLWEKEWHDKIMVVKKEYDTTHYWKRGQKAVTEYYEQYFPFDQGNTLETEARVVFNLDPEGKHKIQGYIDRIVFLKDGMYEIHDYKTASRPPTEESLKEDRQLALYQIAIQERYSDVKDVRLVWHYLTFGKEFSSRRTADELEALKKRTIELIERIEATEDFAPKENPICPWCGYQYLCPFRKHLVKVETMPLSEYLKEDGVTLVNRYMELAEKEKAMEKELETVKEALIEYSKREECNVIRGARHKIKLWQEDYFHFPGTGLKEKDQRAMLEEVIKKSGRLNDVFHLDVHALNRKVLGDDWPEDLLEKVKGFGTQKTTYRLSHSKLRNEETED